MTYEFFCVTLFGLLIGIAFAFSGYSLFRSMLPLIGFFSGFALGVQTMQHLFGVGFLASLTSWIVGVLVAMVFSALSYLFFNFAIAILAGSLGYGVGASIMLWIGMKPGVIVWLVGIVLGLVMIAVTFKFKLAKYLIVVDTAIFGAAIMISTLLSRAAGVSMTGMVENPIRALIQNSPLWVLLFLVIVAVGIVVQLKSPSFSLWTESSMRDYDPTKYNPNP